MGTNYYYHETPPCDHCGRKDEPLHIGKSGAGWCFSLHVIPDDGINDLDDWRELWKKENSIIEDEYGRSLTAEEMEEVITGRGRKEDWEDFEKRQIGSYSSESDFHSKNHSQRGPNGLLRHQIDSRCIKHGKGTWDCILGWFS